MYRYKPDQFAGQPTHLLYGPQGVLEFRVAGLLPAHLLVHRPVCNPACEQRDEYADGDCAGSNQCERLEMACHSSMHTGIDTFTREIADLAALAGDEAIAAGLRTLYPRIMRYPD